MGDVKRTTATGPVKWVHVNLTRVLHSLSKHSDEVSVILTRGPIGWCNYPVGSLNRAHIWLPTVRHVANALLGVMLAQRAVVRDMNVGCYNWPASAFVLENMLTGLVVVRSTDVATLERFPKALPQSVRACSIRFCELIAGTVPSSDAIAAQEGVPWLVLKVRDAEVVDGPAVTYRRDRGGDAILQRLGCSSVMSSAARAGMAAAAPSCRNVPRLWSAMGMIP